MAGWLHLLVPDPLIKIKGFLFLSNLLEMTPRSNVRNLFLQSSRFAWYFSYVKSYLPVELFNINS